jgi:hypothetical protein
MERTSCILFHVRKLGRKGLTAAAARLCRDDFSLVQQGLKLLEISDALEKAPSGTSFGKGRAAEDSKRKLKKGNSDVSMAGNGFPEVFEDSHAGTPKKNRHFLCCSVHCQKKAWANGILEKDGLQAALGYGKRPLKRPASALENALKRPASALEKVEKAKPKKDAGKKEKKNHRKKNLFGKGGEKALAQDKENCGQEESQVLLAGTTEKRWKVCPDWHSQMIDEIWTSGKGSIDKVRGQRPEGKTLQGMGCQRVDTVCAPQAFGKVPQQFGSKRVPLEKGMHASEKCPARQALIWGQPTANQFCLRKTCIQEGTGARRG